MPFSRLCPHIVHDFLRSPRAHCCWGSGATPPFWSRACLVLATLERLPRHFSVVLGSQPGLCEGFWFFPCHEKQITPRWHPKYQQFSFSGSLLVFQRKWVCRVAFTERQAAFAPLTFVPTLCPLGMTIWPHSVTIYTLPNLDSSVHLPFQLPVWADGRCSGNTLLFC